jgi:zinc D-Ala-D-Ala carboxypeptidase
MNVSPNFTLEELTASEVAQRKGLDNTPNATETANLIRTAELLEQVRSLLNKPILVNSAFQL